MILCNTVQLSQMAAIRIESDVFKQSTQLQYLLVTLQICTNMNMFKYKWYKYAETAATLNVFVLYQPFCGPLLNTDRIYLQTPIVP